MKGSGILGVLELLKMGLITISQKQLFAPIYIFGKEERHGRKQMLGALEAVFIRCRRSLSLWPSWQW